MKIKGAASADPRFVEALERLAVPRLVSVRHRSGEGLTKFSVRLPLRNKSFGPTFLFLLGCWTQQRDGAAREPSPAELRAFVSQVRALDALFSRFKRTVRLDRYPPHVIVDMTAHGVDVIVDRIGALPPHGEFYWGKFHEGAPEPGNRFGEVLAMFGVTLGPGWIEVFLGSGPVSQDPLVTLAHELLHALEWARGIPRGYEGSSLHVNELLRHAEDALGRDNPFVVEARNLRRKDAGIPRAAAVP